MRVGDSQASAARFLAMRRRRRTKRRQGKPGKPACRLLRIKNDGDVVTYTCSCGRVGGHYVPSKDAERYIVDSWRSHARSKLFWLKGQQLASRRAA